ncbi:hypothetical protein K3165_07660 [Qipengyuania sp. 1XM1-15A]|uniref:hypothetical protein n=1 Tax=Qipengyuania xiamenensis TaxID=2867237 RepID=UPI001C87D47C|nr:hypothetical protein [Qipengyuania xiamenensis]MBX7532795.1 hypothetical protein [Qipengyuania xiamenensis]
MTEIRKHFGGGWINEHRSIAKLHRRKAALHETAGSNVAVELAARAQILQDFIRSEAGKDRELCVTGSGWSQSDLYHNFSTLMTTDDDEGIWELPEEAFRDGVDGQHRYVMVTGGTKIHALMDWLGRSGRDLSLRTAGSHKGQSLAGIVGTGSHGSTLDETGCETHVRGMILSRGHGRDLWLGSPDHPVLRDEWIEQFASVGDSAMFADALVHVGGMGFVSAYLIEAVDEFYCGLVKRARVLPDDWFELVEQGRFAEAMGDIADGAKPHYYELTFDPFDGFGHEVCETIWFDYETDAKPESLGGQVNRTTLEAISEKGVKGLIGVTKHREPEDNPLPAEDLDGRIRDLIDVPRRIFEDFKEHACDERDTPRTLSQLTAEWHPHRLMNIRIDVYNAALAVPRERLGEVMQIAMDMAEGEGNIRQFSKDFVFTVRFAEKSPATMGFLRFDHNAIINIDGLPKNFPLSTDAPLAAERLQHLLKKAGIPFSMHWGKDAQLNAKAIREQYGTKVDRYRATRDAVLGNNAEVFISPALEQWGLGED